MKNIFKIAFYTLFIVIITSCTAVTAQRGSMLSDYQINEIKIGQHSMSDVLHLVGSPTTQSTFNNNVWYYIGQETEKRGILDSKVTKERIVKISFNKDGIVENVEDITGERLDIPYERAKTPTHGNELTFLQQLLGNMGRFNAPQQ